jgi:hypothetical protein
MRIYRLFPAQVDAAKPVRFGAVLNVEWSRAIAKGATIDLEFLRP